MRKLILVILLLPLGLMSQVNSVSPFTLFGVGDLSEGYFVKNMSMGGISAALRDPLFINLANPASLSSLELTALEFGATYRFLKHTDQISGQSIKNNSAYFHYLGMGFKLKDWWGMGISMTPYSRVGYSIYTQEDNPDFGLTQFNFEGEGGINQIVFGNSFEVYKNLSLGANLRYLFGTTKKRISAEFEDPTYYHSRRNIETRVSDVVFDFGLQYDLLLNKDAEGFARNNLVIGATYGNNANVKSKKSIIDYTYQIGSDGNEIPRDTTNSQISKEGNILLPTKYSIGASYGGLTKSKFGNSWLVTADYSQVSWSQYSGFEGEQGLTDSWRASIGAYYIPAYALKGNGRKSQISEIEWRIGGFYEDSHITIEDKPVIVKGITAGFNVPFKPKNLAPGEQKLNNFSFGVVFGTKSSASNTLIQEDFINLTFGLTFNDLWFQKRKYR